MFRRALLLLATVVVAVGGSALPANAILDQTTCYTTPPDPLTSTKATICIDVSGSYRRVYVHGSSLFGPTTLTVNFAYLLQNSTVVVNDCCGWSGNADYYGTGWLVQFGHTYTACASVGVRDPILGGHDFGYICSFSRPN
jgi:hypothetical protein